MFGPEKLADVETFKRLGTEEHDLEESQQGVDLMGKDVGNCKLQTTLTVDLAVWLSTTAALGLASRPAASRAIARSPSWVRRSVPSRCHWANCARTLRHREPQASDPPAEQRGPSAREGMGT